jgi:hypothetical protein
VKAARLLLLAALGTSVLGCARKVVLHPSLVPARNDPAWVVQRPPRSVPRQQAETPPPPPPTRSSLAPRR